MAHRGKEAVKDEFVGEALQGEVVPMGEALRGEVVPMGEALQGEVVPRGKRRRPPLLLVAMH